MRRSLNAEVVVLGLLVVLFVVLVARLLAVGAVLGYDETAYALQARAWVRGTATTGLDHHRGVLVSVLAAVVLMVTTAEWALRLVGLLSGLLAVLATWWLGRSTLSPAAGLIGAAGIISAFTVQSDAAFLLSDLPATALLLAAVALLWHALEGRARPGPGLYLAAPALAGALYARDGSLLPIGLIVVATWLLWGRRHGGLLRSAGLLAVLLVPYLLLSVRDFGSPWGRALWLARAAGGSYPGEGLIDYLRWLPSDLAGPLVAVLIILGLISVAVPGWRRARALLVGLGVAHVALLGLTTQAEPRFVFFPIALLSCSGGSVVAQLRAARRPAVVATALLTLALFTLSDQRALGLHRFARDTNGPVTQAALRLRAAAPGDCLAVTAFPSQIQWYSGCQSTHYTVLAPEQVARAAARRPTFLVVFDQDSELLRAYRALTHSQPVARIDAAGGAFGAGEVLVVRPGA